MDVSMIFGIIFTIIIMSVILIFGAEQIANILGLGAEAQVAKSIDNLQKEVDSYYRQAEDSGGGVSLSFPKNYRLCFFNSSNPARKLYSDRSLTWDPDSTTRYVINASRYNIWYYQGEDDAAGRGRRIPYLDMPTDKNFCAPGGIKIYITNTGNGVEIEPV